MRYSTSRLDSHHRFHVLAAFSLVELLVVVAIIIVLIAILVPALSRAMESAQAAKCATQSRGMAKSMIAWASEHRNSLPNANDFPGNDPARWAWMGNEIGIREDRQISSANLSPNDDGSSSGSLTVPGMFDGYYDAGPNNDPTDPNSYDPANPTGNFYFNGEYQDGEYAGTFVWAPTKEGVLVPYLGGRTQAKRMYRCPSLEVAPLGAAWGSNGLFDYGFAGLFKGARLSLIPATSQWRNPVTKEWFAGPTPMIVEEDPAENINETTPDSQWCNSDHLSPTHANFSGNHGSVDGSVHAISQQFGGAHRGVEARRDITTRAPSGANVLHKFWDFGVFNGL